ncbi:MAG TPA: hypothetical protein VNX26_14600 [Candidatus Acidoferrum sp.]|nr:hypothetical protein [Candidatus Acidoferrum sp.]
MSVCIAAISTTNEIIAIVDRKVASGEFSNEDATTKSGLVNGWLCMFAGNDTAPAPPIMKRANELCSGKENTLEVLVHAFETSYQEYLSRLCESQVLGRWRFKDIEDFREKGRKQFGADVFDTLCHHIEQIKIRCTFLVCGLDHKNAPHIFTVSNPGVAEIRDDPGYWAIGNGQFAAMSILSFFQQSVICTTEETTYQVMTAKLMAETATDVGRASFYWRLRKESGLGTLPSELLYAVREAWTSGGSPTIPDGILEKIKSYLAGSEKSAELSEPETSEQAQ